MISATCNYSYSTSLSSFETLEHKWWSHDDHTAWVKQVLCDCLDHVSWAVISVVQAGADL